MIRSRGILVAIVLWGAACSRAALPLPLRRPALPSPLCRCRPTAYPWRLARGLPVPRVPADNPMTDEKVRLGRRLFYDTRLSGNGTFSCASCHQQNRAFTDGRARMRSVRPAALHPRSAMSLTNVAYNSTLRVGGRARPHARSADGGADVQRASDRDGDQGQRGGDRGAVCLESRRTRNFLPEPSRAMPLRSRSTTPSRPSPRSSGR